MCFSDCKGGIIAYYVLYVVTIWQHSLLTTCLCCVADIIVPLGCWFCCWFCCCLDACHTGCIYVFALRAPDIEWFVLSYCYVAVMASNLYVVNTVMWLPWGHPSWVYVMCRCHDGNTAKACCLGCVAAVRKFKWFTMLCNCHNVISIVWLHEGDTAGCVCCVFDMVASRSL